MHLKILGLCYEGDNNVPLLKEFFRAVGKHISDWFTYQKVATHYVTGNSKIAYYKNGVLHREGDKPAVVSYDPNGWIICEQYYEYGRLHRTGDKPALIIYESIYGDIGCEKYYRDGRLHRDGNKPAFIIYDKNTGAIEYEHYYEDGNQYEKRDEQIISNNRWPKLQLLRLEA